jgi:hypothetical protein
MYYNNSSNKIEVEYVEIGGFVAEESEIEIFPFYPTGFEKQIELLREKNQQIEWVTPQDIGIDVDNKKNHSIGKADLFAEEDRCVLALRFRNAIDSKQDILFLHFQVASSYLLPKGQLINLTTEIKAMIAPTLHRLLLNRLYEMRRDSEQFDLVSVTQSNLYEEIELLRTEKKELQKKYGASLINLCKSYLDDFSKERDYHFVLHANAEEKIAAFTGDISLLRPAIEKTAFVAMTTLIGNGNEIVINDYQIKIEEPVIEAAKQEYIKIVERGSTMAMSILDELEKAAERLTLKKLPLTGINMGNELNGVTHSSITLKLAKYIDNIVKVLYLYPKKWPLIRNDFKPLQNALDKRLHPISSVDQGQMDDQT